MLCSTNTGLAAALPEVPAAGATAPLDYLYCKRRRRMRHFAKGYLAANSTQQGYAQSTMLGQITHCEPISNALYRCNSQLPTPDPCPPCPNSASTSITSQR